MSRGDDEFQSRPTGPRPGRGERILPCLENPRARIFSHKEWLD